MGISTLKALGHIPGIEVANAKARFTGFGATSVPWGGIGIFLAQLDGGAVTGPDFTSINRIVVEIQAVALPQSSADIAVFVADQLIVGD